MLNRIRPISVSDRAQPSFIEPRYRSEPIDEFIFDRPHFIVEQPRYFEPDTIRNNPPALPVVITAKYRFIDSKTGRLVSNVKITRGLRGLGYSVNSRTGTGTFSTTEANKNYTAKANGYDSIKFRPVAGRTITVLMKKTVTTAKYKFVDGATGKIIPNITLSDYKGIDLSKRMSSGGLGTPTLSNGTYTFPASDFNHLYIVRANGYNDSTVYVKVHDGITTIKLTQRATVKFIDSVTKKPVIGVAIKSGLFGLGANYSNSNGLFTFSFRPGEYNQKYTIKANGYKSKDLIVVPGFGIKTIKLDKEQIIIKQPPKISNNDTAKRLRLAKAKAKARIRKIKLLAI